MRRSRVRRTGRFRGGRGRIDLVRSAWWTSCAAQGRVADLLEEQQPDLYNYRTAAYVGRPRTHMRLLAFEPQSQDFVECTDETMSDCGIQDRRRFIGASKVRKIDVSA